MAMTKQPDILKLLNPQYFWDVDLSKLNADKSARLIIDRVFCMGKASEIRLVIEYYGSVNVVEILKSLNYLDPKTLNFVSKLFNVSLRNFKCYRRKQLIPQHWNS
jgi:hypothetical protein